jgi:hypothetical protein
VNIEQLLGTVRAREGVASVDAERDRLPEIAAVGEERLRRSPRLR